MTFVTDAAISNKVPQSLLDVIKNPTVSVGKPPPFTEPYFYAAFQQGRYEVASAFSFVPEASRRENFFTKLFNKLEDFRDLKDDWDKDGAEAPNFASIDKSREILEIISGVNITPTNISPSVEGGISTYFIKDNKYADIECFNSGEVLTSKSDRVNEPEITELFNEDDVINFAEQIKEFIS